MADGRRMQEPGFTSKIEWRRDTALLLLVSGQWKLIEPKKWLFVSSEEELV